MADIALPHFNLLDEPWIPVIMADGERRKAGLLEIFRRADAVRSVEDQSPLVTASLHRALLAILHRALAPETPGVVAEWFDGGWPPDRIVRYLEKWRDRFYLFHATHPFWQTAEYDDREKKPWAVLAAEHNASNSAEAKIFFDFPCRWRGVNAPPEAMARLLAAAQTFALPGGRGYSPSPSSGALVTFSVGGNLRETLLYNLVPQEADVAARDFPAWERDPETARSLKLRPRRSPAGCADLYTWCARAVHLRPEADGTVAHVGFKPGFGLEKENAPAFRDPMVGYKNNGLPLEPGQRGLWRDFDSLLPYRGEGGGLAPLVVEHAEALRRAAGRRSGRLSVMVCGQVNDRAKIESWRMEHFVLPETLSGDSCDAGTTVRHLLELAQTWEGWLRNACLLFAGESLRRNSEHRPAPADVRKIADRLPCMAVYWNYLEHSFRRELEKGFSRDPAETEAAWLRAIRNALSLAWDAQRRAVGDVRDIRAMVKAGGTIGKALASLPSGE